MVGRGRWVVLALLVASGAARACDTPVFLYALERWPADPYEVTVLHRGPLGAEDRALVARLEAPAEDGSARPNVIVRATEDAGRERPWLAVRYPAAAGIEAEVWSGPLTAGAVEELRDSPARQELARRLLAGETVWVLLSSGKAEADASAEKLIGAELGRLSRARPPEAEGPRPVFSLLRVDRADPAERVLVRMLLHSEPDLAGRAEPMAFPVFGRGRVLYALVGAGITPGNVGKAAAFLGGDCSCEVKRECPGTDLLLTADWGSATAAGAEVLPDAPPPEEEEAPSGPGLRRRLLWLGVAVAAVLVVVTGALAWRSTRRPNPG
jgi:hypothetical protein